MSQFHPDLQAKTPEEYDAYLDVLDGASIIEKAKSFERQFPDSTLRLLVCELAARQWRLRGDATEAVAAAERGLAVAADYPPLLAELADLLSNGDVQHNRAEAAARRALELLASAKAPQRVTPEEWTAAVSRLRAQAHGAIGLVRFKRGETAAAIQEFEAALTDSPGDPLVHYRLGRLYAVSKRTADARRHLRQAAEQARDTVLRERAKAALAELR